MMAKAKCWLRTKTANTPSEFVTRLALTNVIKANLCGFAKDWITQLIQQRQENTEIEALEGQVA